MKANLSQSADSAWSLTVRLTHWAVATGVMVNFFNDSGYWHRLLGYACIVFVLLRLVDGFWLARSAASRFFVPRFVDIRLHLHGIRTGQVADHHGHNPLGQLAVYVMWLLIVLLGFTGWISRTDLYWGEDLPVQIHEILSSLLQAMVVLHLLAVLLMSRLQRRNLIKAMIKG
ncbi:cytochrome b/b6 domain-containing protein [Methylotenera sp. G11]|uniref:cytochrome b/b6 domain-containing protein n=1 Tax=Methylotenera sp. G11 TaxID=1506585 RepID=UPI00064733ED|nr:cytochrome b/b6 domain-containing protein [Methylotenera sp. G11]